MSAHALGELSSSAEVPTVVSLDRVAVGEVATIVSIDVERGLRRRLMEMGLLPATRLRVVRRAPMGDPIQLIVRGYSLSIRRKEAAGVLVTHAKPA